jgi:hypothetical protein
MNILGGVVLSHLLKIPRRHEDISESGKDDNEVWNSLRKSLNMMTAAAPSLPPGRYSIARDVALFVTVYN